jgi:hypothetical protein
MRTKPCLVDQVGGAQQVLLFNFALEEHAHALADAVGGDGDRLVAAALHVAEEPRGQAIGAEARDADGAAAVDERGDEVLELGVIGDGGADEADLAGVLGDQPERGGHRQQAHAAARS